MAIKTKTYKKRGTRGYKKAMSRLHKNRNRRRKNTRVQRNIVDLGKGFPKSAKILHKYVDTFSLTCTAGTPNYLRYTVNGMWDVDIKGVGHQPLYFDQSAALWRHYTVIGSKITIRWCNGSTSTPPSVFSLYINDDTTQVNPYPGIISEQPSAKGTTTGFGNNDQHVLTANWSAKKAFRGSILANNDLQGDATKNPAEQQYYDFNFQTLDGGNGTIYGTVTVEYFAIWTELQDVAQS